MKNLKSSYSTCIRWLLSCFVTSASLCAMAGAKDGGGGGAFVCRSPQDHSVQSSTLLDLWEAEHIYQWPIYRNSVETVEAQLNDALRKLKILDPYLAEKTAEMIAVLKTNHANSDTTVVINPPADALSKYSKKDCPLEGMMYFEGTIKKLIIDPSIFEKLETNTDTAAAWLHEAIYKLGRDYFFQNDSINSRKIVACLFSNSSDCLPKQSVQNIMKGQTKVELCKSNHVTFYRGSNGSDMYYGKYVYATVKIGKYDYSSNPYSQLWCEQCDVHPTYYTPSILPNSLLDYRFSSWRINHIARDWDHPQTDGIVVQAVGFDDATSFSEPYTCTSVSTF